MTEGEYKVKLMVSLAVREYFKHTSELAEMHIYHSEVLTTVHRARNQLCILSILVD